MPDKNEGPFLAMALFCDSVVEGKDGVLSVIRVVDTVNVAISSTAANTEQPASEQTVQVPLETTMVVAFRAGTAKGEYKLSLELDTPTGKTVAVGERVISFQGIPEQSVNLISKLNLSIEVAGLYWFNVFLQDEFVTRVPLRVAFQWAAEPARNSSS